MSSPENEHDNPHTPSAQEFFESQIEAADPFFFHMQVPAWIVSTEKGWVAPVSRLYLGNHHGEQIFSRMINLSCSIQLANDLINASVLQGRALKNLDKYFVFVPESKDEYISLLDSLEKGVRELKASIVDLDIRNLAPLEEADSESEPSEK